MNRPLDAARGLLARLVPGAGAGPGAKETDADEEAVRKAFLAPGSLVPAMPTRRALRPKPDAVLEKTPEAVLEAGATAAPVGVMPVGAAMQISSGPLGEPESAGTTFAWRTPDPDPEAPSVASPEEAITRRHQAGDTAPDHLLHAPGSVDRAADDFFDGLVRRVGDR